MNTLLMCAIVSLVLMSTAVTSAQPQNMQQEDGQASQPFRVMSFNIRWGGAADPPSVWEDRRELLLQTIQAYDPDILCVQEAILRQSKYLRDEMDGYIFFGVGRDDGKLAGEMCAIFYRSERFRRIGGGHFWLDEEPDTPGGFGWDASIPRMVSWLRLRDKVDGRVLFVANTHWDHRGKKARLNSARLIRERIPELAEGAPMIVLGDFNCDEDSKPYGVLIAGEQDDAEVLVDTYRAMYPERGQDEATYHGFRGTREGSRIDWILHSLGLQTLAAEIDTTHEGLKYPSDHYPVTATLRLSTPEPALKQAN